MLKNIPTYIKFEIHNIIMDILTAISVGVIILIIQYFIAK